MSQYSLLFTDHLLFKFKVLKGQIIVTERGINVFKIKGARNDKGPAVSLIEDFVS